MNEKVLIVEDEISLTRTLFDRLQKEGYEAKIASDGDLGIELIRRDSFDLLILDLILPGQNGLSVCRILRNLGSTIPILILTGRRQTIDKVIGLRMGADDYLTKPFKMAELLARVHALLRRGALTKTSGVVRYHSGDLEIDTQAKQAKRGGRPVHLSPREFHLLRYFLDHRGATVSREELWREVWGYTDNPRTRTVDVHVTWLRQKIENDPKSPERILTVFGLGYKFVG